MRFHGETAISREDVSKAMTYFLDELVQKNLLKDKQAMFISLMRYPLQTVTLLEKIYMAYEKIFDGKNPVFMYNFNNTQDATDWLGYRKDKKILKTWETKGYETMKSAHNSIIIVDLPAVQTTGKPEPYFYFLDIDDFVAGKENEDNTFEYIIFKQPENRLAVFDDTSYRIFQTKGGNEIEQKPLIETKHDIGKCPARFFWSSTINRNELFIKKHPLSNLLGRLDMLLFWEISNDHLNLYARYPIMAAVATLCNYSNNEIGHYCDKGFLRTTVGGNYLLDDKMHVIDCPVCSKKRINGPGTLINYTPPSAANGNVDLSNPAKWVEAPVSTLEYNKKDVSDLKEEIYHLATGYQGSPVNDKAVNEKQVKSIFESLEAALDPIQKNFEMAMQWTDEIMCHLRYGSQSFVSASVSLGTEHYIMSSTEILDLYKMAQGSTISVSTLDQLEDRYFETEYRNNPEELERQNILKNLDPFRHLSKTEVQKMYDTGQINFEDYMIKLNFSSLIIRFERENVSITEFGQGVEFDTKIKAIREALASYANEMKPEKVNDPIQNGQVIQKKAPAFNN